MNSAPTSKLRVKPTTMITINTTSVCFSIKLFFFASLPFFWKLCGDDRFHHRRAPMTGFTSAPYHTSNWTGKRLDFLSLFPSFAPPSRHSQRVGERGKKGAATSNPTTTNTTMQQFCVYQSRWGYNISGLLLQSLIIIIIIIIHWMLLASLNKKGSLIHHQD
jgi:hypothetical protein